MDVDSYLKRMGYSGPRDTSPSTLFNLCECQARTVPFETIDMFGGERKRLDLQKVYRDVVLNKRGGFCYELNELFHWLLGKFGFELKICQAQAYVKPLDCFSPEFDHMTIVATCSDGSQWLTDVGWGGSSFKVPLRFEENSEQSQNNGVYRLSKLGENVFCVQRRKKRRIGIGEIVSPESVKAHDGAIEEQHPWQSIYKFDSLPRQWSDFEDMCDYQQDDENSFLKHNILAAVTADDGSGDTALCGWLVRKKVFVDPLTEETILIEKAKTQEELKNLLKKYFGVKVNFEVKVECRDIKLLMGM